MVALRRAGTPIPTNDIWVAAVAARAGAIVLSYDHHFDVVSRVGSIVLQEDVRREPPSDTWRIQPQTADPLPRPSGVTKGVDMERTDAEQAILQRERYALDAGLGEIRRGM